MTPRRDSLLHPIHGVAAEDIAAELGHSTSARLNLHERLLSRIMRYVILKLFAFTGFIIETGPGSGSAVTPDENGKIWLQCIDHPDTIQPVEGNKHALRICPPTGGGCTTGYSTINLITDHPPGGGTCSATECNNSLTIDLGECLIGALSCDANGNATISISLDYDCLCEKCPPIG